MLTGRQHLGVTGHRPNKLGGYGNSVKKRLLSFAIDKLEEVKPRRVYTGMALGWDQAIAEACIQLGIPFVGVIPFKGQEHKWPDSAQRHYEFLLGEALGAALAFDGYPKDQWHAVNLMHKRNEYIVNNTDGLLALWNGDESGGTYNCIQYAEGKTNIINVWDQYNERQTT